MNVGEYSLYIYMYISDCTKGLFRGKETPTTNPNKLFVSGILTNYPSN